MAYKPDGLDFADLLGEHFTMERQGDTPIQLVRATEYDRVAGDAWGAKLLVERLQHRVRELEAALDYEMDAHTLLQAEAARLAEELTAERALRGRPPWKVPKRW